MKDEDHVCHVGDVQLEGRVPRTEAGGSYKLHCRLWYVLLAPMLDV